MGGTLWQPDNLAEYNDVFVSIGYSVSGGTPSWYWNAKYFWIGYTWPGGPSTVVSINGDPPIYGISSATVHDGCVAIEGDKVHWAAHHCEEEFPFVCEVILMPINYASFNILYVQIEKEPPHGEPCPCVCHVNGQTYECGESFILDAYSCAYGSCEKDQDGNPVFK